MKICNLTKAIDAKYSNIAQNYLSCLLLLAIRIFVGLVFLRSGLVKFSNIDSAILLFEYEYQVPLLPPILAAYLAMAAEIICGGALIIGFFSKFMAIPLIIMTLVIQFLVVQNQEHYYWLFLLSTIAIYGAGKISIDHIFCSKCKKPAN